MKITEQMADDIVDALIESAVANNCSCGGTHSVDEMGMLEIKFYIHHNDHEDTPESEVYYEKKEIDEQKRLLKWHYETDLPGLKKSLPMLFK